MAEKKDKNFNAIMVELEGVNLIRASAGTGKTYSVALMAVRLIVEKDIPLPQILMVTFTKAAVAEMETRVRRFIRMAYHFIKSKECDDKSIKDIVIKAIEKDGPDKVSNRLETAMNHLDETSIFTIHSFCQRTLTEFAFETGQLFDNDVLEDLSDLIQKAVNEYWRIHVTTFVPERLAILQTAELSRDSLVMVVTKALSGKQFVYNTGLDIESAFLAYDGISDDLEKEIQEFLDLFKRLKAVTNEKIQQNTLARKSDYAKLINDPINFLEVLKSSLKRKEGPQKYVKETCMHLFDQATKVIEKEQTLKISAKEIVCILYGNAIEPVKSHIAKYKERLKLFSYDDLIGILHKSLSKSPTDTLKQGIQGKYKVVFIDEFQDTDKIQYEIFKTIFFDVSSMFFIGDPKQSIYSFRGADLETYKIAAGNVDKTHSMGKNFRSTAGMVKALNYFFQLIPNPFIDEAIPYDEVEAAKALSEMIIDNKIVKPISIMTCESKKVIFEQVAYEVYNVLTIDAKINNRKVKPSDIAILVRSNREGKDIKKALRSINIPAVVMDDLFVMQTEEADLIRYIIYAIIEPSRANINRALLSKYPGLKIKDIIVLKDDYHLSVFKELKRIATEFGIYYAMHSFMNHYKVRETLDKNKDVDADRSISNYLQITELIHKKAVQQQSSLAEILSWMMRSKEGMPLEGDEYIQNLESDKDAVKIITIHKSKGLEYNIVFAPCLDLKNTPTTFHKTIEFKKDNISYFSIDKEEPNLSLYKDQTEKENRRLIYVALTRAIYKCYLYQSTGEAGSITEFIKPIDADTDNKFVDFINLKDKPTSYIPTQEVKETKPELKFVDPKWHSWHLSSFNKLNVKHERTTHIHSVPVDSYDKFVFDTMPRGNTAGLFLHKIFEYMDFSDRTCYGNILKRAGRQFPSVYDEQYEKEYLQLIKHVLNAKLSKTDDLKLSGLVKGQWLSEVEFFFPIEHFDRENILRLFKVCKIDYTNDFKGMIRGTIDMLFKHKDKYYILDWKSNYLGSDLEFYNKQGLDQAMQISNYNLQYLLYTLAAKRFLESKISGFDFEENFGGVYYLFLRGCRLGQDTGIFFARPEPSIIELINKDLMKNPLPV